MANANTPFGLIPIRKLDGTPYMGDTRMFYVPSSDGTAIFVGDIVKLGGTAGSAGTVVNGIDVEGMPTAIQAAAGDTLLLGVVVGFLPNQDNLMQKHRAASTNRIALVVVDPNVIFEAQEDSVGGALAVTEAGENADVIVGAGNATTGISTGMIDSSDHKTATANLRIMRLSQRADNGIGNYAKWEVLINEHAYKTTTGV